MEYSPLPIPAESEGGRLEEWAHERINPPYIWDICLCCNIAFRHTEPMREKCPHCGARFNCC